MKQLFITIAISLLLFICISAFKNTETTAIPFETAIAQKLIKIEFENNPSGSHYLNPICAKITNLKSDQIEILIEKGTMLYPEDDEMQTIVLSNDARIAMLPNQINKSANLAGFCTESYDHAPGTQKMKYKLGLKAKENLQKLIYFIASNKIENTLEGQTAVWTLLNNSNLSEVVGFDTVKVKNLAVFLSKLTNKKMPPPPSTNDYKRNYYTTTYQMKAEIGGNFSFQKSKPFKARIAMFDTNNICVRELFLNENCPAGIQKVSYKFDASQFTDKYYYIKSIVDEKIIFNSRYDIKNGEIKRMN